MTEEIRVLLFDLGGVLVEFTGPSTLLRWLGGRLAPEQVWPLWLGSPVVRDFERGLVEAARAAGLRAVQASGVREAESALVAAGVLA